MTFLVRTRKSGFNPHPAWDLGVLTHLNQLRFMDKDIMIIFYKMDFIARKFTNTICPYILFCNCSRVLGAVVDLVDTLSISKKGIHKISSKVGTHN